MKPPRFDYYDPRSLDEAVALLDKYQHEGKVLAGGQSLMPLLNMRMARPSVIVDINRVDDLSFVRSTDHAVHIGATVRLRALHRERLIAQRFPVLFEAAHHIGHPQIRSRGTICGSLAHADPAAELPALAVALEAQMIATGPDGARTIPAHEFYTGYLATTLQANEILTEVRFPHPRPDMAWAFLEVSRRFGDFALVGVVAGLAVNAERGAISDARLVYFGVGPGPVRSEDAEQALLGQAPGEAAFRAAGEAASERVNPDDDIHASAAYRRSVAAALTERALQQAWRKLGGN